MSEFECMLLSGDEAIAYAAKDAGVALGVGYPGTPSTEILEQFGLLGGKAQWSPNEKVAFEVALGSAFAGARAVVTMKHVGLNVAADPLFTAAYTGVSGALVIVSADDPGMASSQNEQDNRRYAEAAGVPMLEPSDSQEAYDFTMAAIEISEKWKTPVLLRITTRVCHSKTIVRRSGPIEPSFAPHFERDVASRVMVPAYAKPAHRKLRQRLFEIAEWNEQSDLNRVFKGNGIGIIASGIAYMHARDAAPDASFLKIGMSYPLPFDAIRRFVASMEKCYVLEEGDPWLHNALRAEDIPVHGKPEMYRFGEFDVERVRRILQGDTTPERVPPPGKPPQLCPGCSHRTVFEILRDMQCIVSGDIGCYTLGVLPPFSAMDSCVCMGASIGVGLGLRHVLPKEEARRVVSVIGDSTFIHSGITGLVDMVYNPPETGHVVIVLDNGTTAMTGLQEHPATGRSLNHEPATQVSIEGIARALGISHTTVLDPVRQKAEFQKLLESHLQNQDLALIVARRPCILAAKKIQEYECAAVSSDCQES